MQVYTPKEKYDPTTNKNKIKLFLAGSIEMGKAEDWQNKMIDDLYDLGEEYIIFNPRRDDWNSDWNKTKMNPKLIAQINWELDRLEEADVIALYFDPNTTSMISLLELGKFVDDKKIILYCPEEYSKYENVYVTFKRYRYNWEYYNCQTWSDFVSKVRTELLFINTI